jgi:hypothetical protein
MERITDKQTADSIVGFIEENGIPSKDIVRLGI